MLEFKGLEQKISNISSEYQKEKCPRKKNNDNSNNLKHQAKLSNSLRWFEKTKK